MVNGHFPLKDVEGYDMRQGKWLIIPRNTGMESSTTQQYVSRLVSSTQKDIPADEPQKTKLILRLTMNLREYQVQTQASNIQLKLKLKPD